MTTAALVAVPCAHLAWRTRRQISDAVAAFEAADLVLERVPPEDAAALFAVYESPQAHVDVSRHIVERAHGTCQCLLCAPRPVFPAPAVDVCCCCCARRPTDSVIEGGLCVECRADAAAYGTCEACGAVVMAAEDGSLQCAGRLDLGNNDSVAVRRLFI